MTLDIARLAEARDNLHEALRSIPASGSNGFEGLIAQILSRLVGERFYLERSGVQSGRDLLSSGCRIAVECKRYRSSTTHDLRSLLGELTEVSQDIEDLEMWVLVTTKPLSGRELEAIRRTCRSNGIFFGAIDTSETEDKIDDLSVLCANSPQPVASILSEICPEQEAIVKNAIDTIRNSEGFRQHIEQLRSRFADNTIGLSFMRNSIHDLLLASWKDKNKSEINFAQNIAFLSKNHPYIRRDQYIESLHKIHTRIQK